MKQLEVIKEQFNKVIAYSQGIEKPNIDDLFDRWLDAKRDFIEAMNGELIWEWPEQVSFELGQKEKNLRIDDFISMVANRWRNDELADFIDIERNGFFSNQVVASYRTSEGCEIPKGMKLLKSFKYFEKDIKALNDIQSAASMIIQEDKITGTLCLSVHPLDFLSSSENNHNWRSCHSLDGEYRSGNLSYMVDKSTIMCYLKSKNDEVLPNFPEDVKWNSKKWRVLLFFSDDWTMLFAGRQYPFYADSGLNFVKDRILPVLHMGEWSDWNRKKLKSFEENDYTTYFASPYIPVSDYLVSMRDMIINLPGSLQYNDLLFSTCYDPVYAYQVRGRHWGDGMFRTASKNTRFKIGGHVKCCRCGRHEIEISESFMCNDCELEYGTTDNDMFATCPCCGRRFIYDDGCWITGAEETICPDCADEYTDWCSGCGERFYKSDLIYDRNTESLYCALCSDEEGNY